MSFNENARVIQPNNQQCFSKPTPLLPPRLAPPHAHERPGEGELTAWDKLRYPY